jgi:hypothetical protein
MGSKADESAAHLASPGLVARAPAVVPIQRQPLDHVSISVPRTHHLESLMDYRIGVVGAESNHAQLPSALFLSYILSLTTAAILARI